MSYADFTIYANHETRKVINLKIFVDLFECLKKINKPLNIYGVLF